MSHDRCWSGYGDRSASISEALFVCMSLIASLWEYFLQLHEDVARYNAVSSNFNIYPH